MNLKLLPSNQNLSHGAMSLSSLLKMQLNSMGQSPPVELNSWAASQEMFRL
jgi:hypothetical protein